MNQPVFFLACLALVSGRLSANPVLTEAQLDSLDKSFDLNEVVVTGTRTPKLLKDTPILTRLISENEIRRSDATNIQDLLAQELPGVEFSYAMDQQVNMNLAGFAGQGVLILLDGERLAGETLDNVDFSRLGMNGISRVEIVQGAASALYGSSAAGGVINIISKKVDKPFRMNLNTRAADHGEWRAGGDVAFKLGRVKNVLDVSYNKIDTYTVCLDTKDLCDFRTVYGSHSWNFRDRFSFSPVDNMKLSARAGYYFKERLYNPDTPDRYRDFSAGLRGEWAITNSDHLELSYAFDQYDKSDYIKDFNLDVRDYSNVQHTVRGLFTHSLRQSDALTVGADVMRDYIDTYQFSPGETHSQYTADAFAQYDYNINKQWELIGALRYDYFSDGDNNNVTAKLSGRYRIADLSLRGGYSGGFRAPSLKEKYMNFNMADIFDIHGNPDLKAEKSHNFNLSAEYTYRNFYFTLAGNYNVVANRISTSGIRYTSDNTPYIDYLNIKKLRVYGLDVTVRGVWQCGLSASLSYNFTREESRGSSASQYCPARPHSLNARLQWSKEWVKGYDTTLTLSGRFLSKVSYLSMYMYEPFETKKIVNPAYTLWKVQLSQRVTRYFSFNVAVDNIFNYAPAVYSYNAPVTLGANLMVGLNIDID